MSELQEQDRSRLTDKAFLDGMRDHGDPLVAKVVEQLVNLPTTKEFGVLSLFRELTHTTETIPDTLPDFIKDYFEDTEELPEWADRDKLKRAANLFSEYGPEIVMILFCKSLPLSYSCWRGAEVLVSTGRLTSERKEDLAKFNRRIMETAQFVLNVMAPRGFGRKGLAIRTAQKIRLIHGSIRYFLAEADWDFDTYGVPINQEDMAGTLMSFSWVILEGLGQLGYQIDDEDQEAYIHCWNVIGYFLGLSEELLPADVEQAKSLTEAILTQQSGPSEAGTLLTESLIEYMREEFFFWPVKCFPAFLMRKLVGEKTANMLEIPNKACHIGALMLDIVEWIFGLLHKKENESPVLRKVFGFFTRKLLQRLVLIYNQEKQVRFVIPPSLSGQWKIG